MLSLFDDYPIHQTPEPIRVPATSDRNAYDRYWFNGMTADGSVYFAVALGRYPNRFVLDGGFTVATGGAQRSCFVSRLAPGDPRHPADCAGGGTAAPTTYEGENTTHLTVADKWGNVVAYTLTIEQTGGSGITVPGRGFLLNNELTDFSFAPANPAVHDPNLPGPGKRPRSSIAPTIVLREACGSPGESGVVWRCIRTRLRAAM